LSYDVIIKNGTVIDGSGMPRFRADIGVVNGKIAKIGKIRESAATEIDAEGRFVTPGFVDGHTHLDAQAWWDSMAGSDPWHGVTTAVMGNCSFSIAPCKEEDKDLVFRSLERSEDVPRTALQAGVKWQWETFSQYMDALDKRPLGINLAPLVGHSALRTYVMGERAFEEEATADDLKAMCAEMKDAIEAGAFGFSSSRRTAHLTSDDRPIASRQANWEELYALGRTVGDAGGGVIQGLGGSKPQDDERIERANLRKLALESGCLLLESGIRNSDVDRLPYWAESTEMGARMMGFVRPKRFELVIGFRVKLPFDTLESWKPVRALPIAEQQEIFRDPERRAQLVHDALTLPSGSLTGAEARPPIYERMYLMTDLLGEKVTVADIARQRGISPVDAMVDLALETDFQQLYSQPDDDLTELSDEALLAMLRHPNTVMAGSDVGAHTTQCLDADFPTTLLGRWVRQREAFTWEEAVRMLTFEPASVWNIPDRGLLREGAVADIVVFDPAKVGPGTPFVDNCLPDGGGQIRARANGIHSVIVAGVEVLRDNEQTGAMPGKILRNKAACA
jgi:N-acyl-D-aspartate/D-glutamate deacylase